MVQTNLDPAPLNDTPGFLTKENLTVVLPSRNYLKYALLRCAVTHPVHPIGSPMIPAVVNSLVS